MYYVNPHIQKLERVKFHVSRRGVLRLDMNESPTGLPEAFVKEIRQRITPEFLATYPEQDALKELLAEKLERRTNEIAITAGADEAMRLIFQCFGEPGKKLFTAAPTFEMYGVYAKMFGMRHEAAQYDESLELPLSKLMERIDANTTMAVLLNPDSPIGTKRSRADIERLAAVAKKQNALLLLDETYNGFGDTKSSVDLVEHCENLLILRTFSKLWALAGLRIGFVVGAPEWIRCIENASSTFNVNSVALLFAEALLKRPEIAAHLQATEAEGHAWLADELRAAGYPVHSEGGNYLLFRPRCDSKQLVAALKQRGVWIRDYSAGAIRGWVRVSTGAKAAMERFWRELKETDGMRCKG